uniref:hypothetical protein n=1 Tax=Phenylobacterium sp. TaxID=1871053 RepID=UPI0025FAEE06
MTDHPNLFARRGRALAMLAALGLLFAQVPASAPAQTAVRPCPQGPVDSRLACSGQPLDAREDPLRVVGAAVALPDGRRGESYPDTQLVTGGMPGYAGEVIGALPPGMSVLASGVLVGTPARPGRFAFTLVLRDGSRPPQEIRQPFV